MTPSRPRTARRPVGRLLLTVLLSAVFLLNSGPSSAATIEAEKGSFNRIRVTGTLINGDAAKLKAAMANYDPSNYLATGEVVFDCPGGNYSEGLEMATYIFEQGWQTRVEQNAVCMSGCAVAFLGGRTFSADRTSWVPAKTLEEGATLGFHSPYTDQEGNDIGRFPPTYFYEFASFARLSSDVFNRIFKIKEGKKLMVNYPRIIDSLSIRVDWKNKKKRFSVTSENSQNICMNLMAQRGPKEQFVFNPQAKYISIDEYKKYRLGKLVEYASDSEKQSMLAKALQADDIAEIARLYDMEAESGKVTPVAETAQIIRVDGLEAKSRLLTRTGFLLVSDNGTDNVKAVYELWPLGTRYGAGEKGELSVGTGLVQRMYRPDEHLW